MTEARIRDGVGELTDLFRSHTRLGVGLNHYVTGVNVGLSEAVRKLTVDKNRTGDGKICDCVGELAGVGVGAVGGVEI